jgi:hypothetical protein
VPAKPAGISASARGTFCTVIAEIWKARSLLLHAARIGHCYPTATRRRRPVRSQKRHMNVVLVTVRLFAAFNRATSRRPTTIRSSIRDDLGSQHSRVPLITHPARPLEASAHTPRSHPILCFRLSSRPRLSAALSLLRPAVHYPPPPPRPKLAVLSRVHADVLQTAGTQLRVFRTLRLPRLRHGPGRVGFDMVDRQA